VAGLTAAKLRRNCWRRAWNEGKRAKVEKEIELLEEGMRILR
jgi:hypothetical protein